MSKPSKTGSTENAPGEPIPFEEALKKLQTVVEAMESDDLPLEAMLARFEEGVRLTRTCQAKLAEAELKIQKLEKSIAGDPVLRPLALSSDTP